MKLKIISMFCIYVLFLFLFCGISYSRDSDYFIGGYNNPFCEYDQINKKVFSAKEDEPTWQTFTPLDNMSNLRGISISPASYASGNVIAKYNIDRIEVGSIFGLPFWNNDKVDILDILIGVIAFLIFCKAIKILQKKEEK